MTLARVFGWNLLYVDKLKISLNHIIPLRDASILFYKKSVDKKSITTGPEISEDVLQKRCS